MPLERAHEYAGQSQVSIDALPSTLNSFSRSEAVEIAEDWLAFFRTATSITDLQISSRATDETLAALSLQTQLTSLQLRFGPYTDLAPLARLDRLEELVLQGATGISDLGPLRQLPRLRRLWIEDARRLNDFSPLAGLDLEELTVTCSINGARWDVKSLAFIVELPRLRKFFWVPRLADLDYSPALSLTDADSVYIAPVRNMQPSAVDLEWALPGIRARLHERGVHRIPVVSSDGHVAILTNDVTGRTVWDAPTEDEERAAREPRPIGRAPITGIVSGTTYRTVSTSARMRTERLRCRLETPPGQARFGIPDREQTIGEYRFTGPASGPLLVWDAPVNDGADSASREDFAGNLETRPFPPPDPDWFADSASTPPLPPAEMWSMLSDIVASLDLDDFSAAVARLTACSPDAVLAWVHTFDDHAARLRPSIDAIIAGFGLPPEESFSLIGAVMAQGETAWQAVVDDREAFAFEWRTATGDALLDVGASAVQTHFPAARRLVSPLTPWADDLRRIIPAWAEEEIESNRWFLPVRAHVEAEGVIRERVVLVDMEVYDAADAAVQAMHSFGGTVIAGPELSAGVVPGLDRLHLVYTVRKWRGTTRA